MADSGVETGNDSDSVERPCAGVAGLALTAARESRLRGASSTNNAELVERLLALDVNPDAADERGRTALHLAACHGYQDAIAALIQHGADPNVRDSLGNTPLHLAVCTGRGGAVSTLLAAGTDVRSRDRHGRSPLELAQAKLRLMRLRPRVGPGALGAPADTARLRREVAQIVALMLKVLRGRGEASGGALQAVQAVRRRLPHADTPQQLDKQVQALLESLTHLDLTA